MGVKKRVANICLTDLHATSMKCSRLNNKQTKKNTHTQTTKKGDFIILYQTLKIVCMGSHQGKACLFYFRYFEASQNKISFVKINYKYKAMRINHFHNHVYFLTIMIMILLEANLKEGNRLNGSYLIN